MRKSPIKSALLTDTLKFTMFSRHFGSCWDTQHFLSATKLLLLSRSMRIDYNKLSEVNFETSSKLVLKHLQRQCFALPI